MEASTKSPPIDMHWFEVMGIEHTVVDSMLATGMSAPTRYLINQAAADVFETEDPVGKSFDFVNETDPDVDTSSPAFYRRCT